MECHLNLQSCASDVMVGRTLTERLIIGRIIWASITVLNTCLRLLWPWQGGHVLLAWHDVSRQVFCNLVCGQSHMEQLYMCTYSLQMITICLNG